MSSLQRDLEARVDGEVRFDAGSRAAYAHDSSNYRQTPIGVVVPHSAEAAVEAVRVCHEHGAPLLSRGGGTSLAGQCCNEGVVIDWSKYCNRLVWLDERRRRALVEPGVCLDDLNDRLKPHGLHVGPKPSTHDTCTIGGMVGNNSCGASAQAYGKMVVSVIRLEVLTYDGVRMWVGETSDEEYEKILAEGGRRAEIYRAMRDLRDENLALIRTRYPDIPRRVSGYNLDSLLPERGFNVARALVGSESTLVTVLQAEIELLPVPKCQARAARCRCTAPAASPPMTRPGPGSSSGAGPGTSASHASRSRLVRRGGPGRAATCGASSSPARSSAAAWSCTPTPTARTPPNRRSASPGRPPTSTCGGSRSPSPLTQTGRRRALPRPLGGRT